MATLIEPSGKTTAVAPKNGKSFSLEELQGFVHGYIEMLRVSRDGTQRLIVDEEGKLKNYPHNEVATLKAAGYIQHGDCIVGNALFCTDVEACGE
jgi:hypothetical protein